MPDSKGGKKLVLTRYGQSREDAVDNILKLEDSPLPDVTKLEPHDVLVGVRSASVSFIDLLMMSVAVRAFTRRRLEATLQLQKNPRVKC